MWTKEKYHDEEIHFDNKTRQTIHDVDFSEQGNWWHKRTKDGRYYIFNPDRILFIRVYEKPVKPPKEKK